jgi:ABC-type glycerol-3-phosphate transport system substrate-binding protein
MGPGVASSYIVDGKMVAIPYQIQSGVLEYRADLLREYGYDHPPRTWDELERPIDWKWGSDMRTILPCM